MSTPPDTEHTAAATEDGFDQVIHAPMRLRIRAAPDRVREIEFGTLLTLLDISKSALSKHISVLADEPPTMTMSPPCAGSLEAANHGIREELKGQFHVIRAMAPKIHRG